MFRKNNLTCFVIIFIPTLFISAQNQEDILQKRLQYEISVNVQLIPIFAIDSLGNPVYNLKKEEIQLFTDGQLTDIIYFTQYRLKDETKQPSKRRASGPSLERLNFIILDTLISNKNTAVPAQAIALGIIKQAPPDDAFVIMESNQLTGLRYIIGPEKNKRKLNKAIKKIVKRYMRRRVWLTHKLPKAHDYSDPKAYEIALEMYGVVYNQTQREREKYQHDIWLFSDSLSQLKYALKTITNPKTVYLISAGPITGAMENSTTYYRFLENAAREINLGGSMFYLINPIKQKKEATGRELKFMADQVGGKFIVGSSTTDIVEQIKRSTSAYYEVAYNTENKTERRSRIQLKCERENIELITISYSERNIPYHQMNPMEKRMFALNVANRGSWSRMVSHVEKVKFKDITKKSEGRLKTIEVKLPATMKDRPLDIF